MRSDAGCLPLEVQIVALVGLFSALEYLADLRMIHRDVKPVGQHSTPTHKYTHTQIHTLTHTHTHTRTHTHTHTHTHASRCLTLTAALPPQANILAVVDGLEEAAEAPPQLRKVLLADFGEAKQLTQV